VRDFTIAQAPAGLALVLQPRQTTTLLARGVPRADWPAVRMIYRGTNQDGCKAAIVTLRYTVSGRQFKR
jgi:hypothetical protein